MFGLHRRFGATLRCAGGLLQRHLGWLTTHQLPSTDLPLFQENKAREEQLAKKLREAQPWGYQAILATLDRLEPSARAPFEPLLPKFPVSLQVAQFTHRLRPSKNDKVLR